MRVHHLNNVNKALQILEQNNVKLVNISSNDIVDGNPKLTLGLVWSIILHWQVRSNFYQNRVLFIYDRVSLKSITYSKTDCRTKEKIL